MFQYPYRRDAETGLTTATREKPFIPPSAQGTIAAFEARGHTVKVRRNKHGSSRYTLDCERERTALALSNRYAKLYGG